ncbi:hypothetical protein [Propionivibrio limicola]|uniref:hypothetical protein n=1 Tax=Propionivibrio limicola TaxID=167645 RepID=UPI001290C1EA|nr:hypothetical protein [Propionivibrio limicola]
MMLFDAKQECDTTCRSTHANFVRTFDGDPHEKQNVRASCAACILCCQDLVFSRSSAHYAEKLSALCPEQDFEIQLVLAAFDVDVVSELQRLGRRQIPSILLPKMMNWLQRESALSEEEARWSVHSWAMALGLIEFAEEPIPAPEVPHCL